MHTILQLDGSTASRVRQTGEIDQLERGGGTNPQRGPKHGSIEGTEPPPPPEPSTPSISLDH